MGEIKIYIELLDEGTRCWRPTTAVELGDGRYKVLATPNYDSEDEIWAFKPGSVVRIAQQTTHEGEQIPVATEDVDANSRCS